MNEALLHKLAGKVDGRFKLTALVQKRLVQLMAHRDAVITDNSGGRPIRLVVEEVAKGHLQLIASDESPLTPKLEEPLLVAAKEE